MRLFPSFVTLATALDAEEAAWVARWRRPPQSKKHHWHRLAGPIDVSCTFRYRLGLTKDAVGAAGPALRSRPSRPQLSSCGGGAGAWAGGGAATGSPKRSRAPVG